MKYSVSIITFFIMLLANSCDSVSTQIVNNDVICDTIIVIEKSSDTIYLEKENSEQSSTYYVMEHFPDWVLEADTINKLLLKSGCEFDQRMNPMYFEEDFNGDGVIDFAIPIQNKETNKVGFAIVHGNSFNLFIIGAGTKVENDLTDDWDYINIWKINRKEINNAGLEENTGSGKDGELILDNPSLEIEKSEVGGGLLYWNGKSYAYFHQTC